MSRNDTLVCTLVRTFREQKTFNERFSKGVQFAVRKSEARCEGKTIKNSFH